MYEPYLTTEEYNTLGGNIPSEKQAQFIEAASRHIDSLTFNRIVKAGFSSLSVFQQEIVKKTCFDMANFEYENTDALQSLLSGYSINGVSMNFGSGLNVCSIGGITVKRDTYELLLQTGLCYRGIG